MDKLEEEILRARKEADELRRKAEAKELELRALLKAAQLRPLQPPSADAALMSLLQPRSIANLPTSFQNVEPKLSAMSLLGLTDCALENNSPRRNSGRQEGAISNKWRAVLAGMYARKDLHTVDEILLLASVNGVELQEPSAHARMRRYADLGYIAEEDGRYRVTEAAAERFGFGASEPRGAP